MNLRLNHKIKLFFTVLFVGITSVLCAQKDKEFSTVDKIALQIPDSAALSSKGIAGYVNANFTNPMDKARAIFIWIAKNIQYDVDNMFAINFYADKDEIVDVVLVTKKGICMHYAELFNDIANRVGLKSYVISGYTKQAGFLDYVPHAWCGALIDSTWCLFDPTWGAGYIENKKFVKHLNTFYFNTKPEDLIKSHMPFDPLWEFLNYPVTNSDFYKGKVSINKNKTFFNYPDSIKRYEHESDIEKLMSSSDRIEHNGAVNNSMIFSKLEHNKREIEYYKNKMNDEKNKQDVSNYNAAVHSYNEGIQRLNKFVEYRNKQFTPSIPDENIKLMLDSTEACLNLSKVTLGIIKEPEKNIESSMLQLTNTINDAVKNLNEQKAFLDKYIHTRKLFRKSLFYNSSRK